MHNRSTKTSKDKIKSTMSFLAANADFFAAPFLATTAFNTWGQANKDELKPLSDDIQTALNDHPDDPFHYAHAKFRRAIEQLFQERNQYFAKHQNDGAARHYKSHQYAPRLKTFLEDYPAMVNVLQENKFNPIISNWYKSQATDNQRRIHAELDAQIDARLHRKIEKQKKLAKESSQLQTAQKIFDYKRACFSYIQQLKDKINTDLEKIQDKSTLDKLSKVLICTNGDVGISMVEADAMSLQKKRIYAALLSKYDDIQSATTINNDIACITSMQQSSLTSNLNIYMAIKQATALLSHRGKNDQDRDVIKRFHTCLNDNKAILTRGNNNEFNTFVKSLDVVIGLTPRLERRTTGLAKQSMFKPSHTQDDISFHPVHYDSHKHF